VRSEKHVQSPELLEMLDKWVPPITDDRNPRVGVYPILSRGELLITIRVDVENTSRGDIAPLVESALDASLYHYFGESQ
jgi:hypothetical protein